MSTIESKTNMEQLQVEKSKKPKRKVKIRKHPLVDKATEKKTRNAVLAYLKMQKEKSA